MHFTDKDILQEDGHNIDTSSYKVRPTTRILIFNEKNEILFVENKWPPHMFDLPGGGVDEGETQEECALRECKEETGAEIANLQLIAHSTAHEHHTERSFDLYYYAADIVNIGEKTTTNELEKNKQLRWFSKEEYLNYAQEFLYTNEGNKNRPMWANKYILENLDKYVFHNYDD